MFNVLLCSADPLDNRVILLQPQQKLVCDHTPLPVATDGTTFVLSIYLGQIYFLLKFHGYFTKPRGSIGGFSLCRRGAEEAATFGPIRGRNFSALGGRQQLGRPIPRLWGRRRRLVNSELEVSALRIVIG